MAAYVFDFCVDGHEDQSFLYTTHRTQFTGLLGVANGRRLMQVSEQESTGWIEAVIKPFLSPIYLAVAAFVSPLVVTIT